MYENFRRRLFLILHLSLEAESGIWPNIIGEVPFQYVIPISHRICLHASDVIVSVSLLLDSN
jgi:hypothetical protein